MPDATYWVYVLASRPYGTLYIGVTNDLLGRIEAHREGTGSKFTARYRVTKLVHYEEFADIELAIQREKTLKHWVRQWKINLIEANNPLAGTSAGAPPSSRSSPLDNLNGSFRGAHPGPAIACMRIDGRAAATAVASGIRNDLRHSVEHSSRRRDRRRGAEQGVPEAVLARP